MKCENIIGFKQQELELLKKCNYSNKNPLRFLKWFLQKAESFDKVDLKLSQKVSKITDSSVKMCYHNCWKAITEPQFYFKLRYFEGFTWSKDCPIPLEHSWLVARNGKVVDPTLIIDPITATKQLKKQYKFVDKDYYSDRKRIGDEYLGVEFPRDTLNKFVFLHKRTGSFLPELFLSGKI